MTLLENQLRVAALLAGPQTGITSTSAARDAGQILEARLQAAAQLDTLHIKDNDPRVRFVKTALACIQRIQSCMLALHVTDNLIGAIDLKHINTLLQLIIYLGIYPSLEQNVGVPLSKRTKFPLMSLEEDAPAPATNLNLLADVCINLAEVAVTHERATVISTLVVSKHLIDIYAGCLQIMYQAPLVNDLIPTEEIAAVQVNVKAHFDILVKNIPLTVSFETFLSLLRASPPNWLRSQLTRALSDIIMKPGGVRAVFDCLLPDSAATGKLETAQLQHIAQLITSVPKHVTKKDYFKCICPQLLEQFITMPESSPIYLAATFSIIHLVNRHPVIGKRLLINPLISPLMAFYEGAAIANETEDQLQKATRNLKKDLDDHPILVDEDSVRESVAHVCKLFEGNETCSGLVHTLSSVVPPLYYIYAFASKSGSDLLNSTRKALITYFRAAFVEEAADIVWKTVALVPSQSPTIVVAGETGGVAFALGSGEDCVEVDLQQLLEFLDAIQREELVAALFIHLLEVRSRSSPEEGVAEIREEIDRAEKHLAMHLIMSIMERYGESVLKQPYHILNFTKSMLVAEDDIETLTMGLGLLTAVLGNDEVFQNAKTRPIVNEITILVQALASHDVPEIAEMATAIKNMIATKNMLFEIMDHSKEEDNSGPSRQSSADVLRECLADLQDDLVPVRAHGMFHLRNLILEADPVVEEKLDSLTTAILDQTDHPDSFVYLNAVKGLSALTDVYPKETLQSIVARYTDQSYSLDIRLRVGEALLQTIQRCGEVFPKYAPAILDPILRVLHDTTTEIRSSALSLLACIAETAPLSLLPFLYQVLSYLKTVLATGKEPVETRRGAVVALLSLIRGLNTQLLTSEVIPQSTLKEITTQLRNTSELDPDDLTKGHARRALADLKEIVGLVLGS
ncbi:armadillo-type protein [Phlyctochytrium arcticum]|nr:armadillo-type protein [Phlyctochytrium arcticum]